MLVINCHSNTNTTINNDMNTNVSSIDPSNKQIVIILVARGPGNLADGSALLRGRRYVAQ